MANNTIQFKRTSTSGLLPNTTNSSNNAYIPAGSFAVNLTDKKVISSDGSLPFEVGANVSNQTVTGNISLTTNGSRIKFATVNSSAASYMSQQTDDNFVFYSTDTSYNPRAIWSVFANSTSSNLQFAVRTQINGGMYIPPGVTILDSTGSQGSTGQILTSNGAGNVYWSTISGGTGSINTAAQYTFSNTITFTQVINGTANVANYIGTLSAANVVSNVQLQANLANYTPNTTVYSTFAQNTAIYAYAASNIAVYSTFAQNTAIYAYAASNAYVNSTFQTMAGLSANVATLTSNNTTYVNGKTEGNLNVNSAATATNANNTTYLNGQLASYYTNATNITTGTLPWAQAPSGTVNTSGTFTFSGVETFNANVVIAGNSTSQLLISTINATSNGVTLTNNLMQIGNTSVYTNVIPGSVYTTNLYGTLQTTSQPNITANNSNYLGGTAASGYQTTAGLAANVATLTSNNTSFVGTVSAANVVSNVQLQANLLNYTPNTTVYSTFAQNTAIYAYAASNIAVYSTFAQNTAIYAYVNSTFQTTVGLASNVATLTSNNTSFVGNVSAANVVSNTQLQANLLNYTPNTTVYSTFAQNTAIYAYVNSTFQTMAGLSANVATLTSNNTSFVGTVSAANVVSNTQLQANLANYTTNTTVYSTFAQNTAIYAYAASNAYVNSTFAQNTAIYAYAASNAYVNSTFQTMAGLSANVATLTANNTTYVNGKTEGNLNVNSAATATNANNASYLGGTAAAGYQTTAGLSANVATLAANTSTYMSGIGPLSGNIDTQWTTGMYGYSPSTTGTKPTAGYGTVMNILDSGTTHDNSSNWLAQLAFDTGNSSTFFRTKINSSAFTAWNTLLHNNNYNAFAPSLTGANASGLWGISVTGTSNNAFYLGGTIASGYQTTAGLSANVLTLAANSSTYSNASVSNTFTVGTASYFVANGNVGIGTSTANARLSLGALVSNKVFALYDDGTNQYGMGIASSQYRMFAATGASLCFGNYARSTDTFTETVRIDSNGNLGIGTTSPVNNAGYGGLTLNGTTGGIGSFSVGGTETFRTQVVSTYAQLNAITAIPLIFNTNNTERMRITSTGTVGIGTSTPQRLLHVGGGSVLADSLGSIGQYDMVYGSASTWYNAGWRNDGSNVYLLGSSVQTTQASAFTATWNNYRPFTYNLGTGAVSIDTGSSLGGTTIGGALTIGSAGGSSQLNISGYNAYGGTGYFGFLTVTNQYGSATNPNKYFRINSSGGLEIINNAYNTVLFSFSDAGGFAAQGSTYVTGNMYDNSNTAYYLKPSSTSILNNTQHNSIGVGTAPSGTTGEIRATNNISAYYSDRRLKTDIVPIYDALSKVLRISGVTFKSNEIAATYGYTDTKTQVGVIAQEIEEVLPEIVVPAPFDIGQNEDGTEYSISGENYKTVQYDKLVPLLIEAIKEQQTYINTLEDKINLILQKLEDK